MDSIIQQIEHLVQSVDDEGRKQVLDSILKLRNKIEQPYNKLQRLAGMSLELTAARIGADLSIFKHLQESDGQPLTIAFLAEKTGAAPVLLGRILRYLASVGMIGESGMDEFNSNATTAVLAQEGYEGGIYHFFDNVGPVLQMLPDFLAETHYQDIEDSTKTPFQKAFDTPLPAFMWLPSQPKRFGSLQQVMTVQQAGATPWFTVFPFEQKVGDWHGKPVFVDIGGGFGHQCQSLKQAFPQFTGQLVLQDIPQTLEHVPPIDGVQTMVQNFFEPQAVKGAKFYYLRNVLHDWPDRRCVDILRNLILAMEPGSKILIDEMVVPNVCAHWQTTQIDLTMMASLGSKERTEAQWRALLNEAGLVIIQITTYISPRQDSIIEVVPK